MRMLMKENQDLQEENLKLSFDISKLKKELGKVLHFVHLLYYSTKNVVIVVVIMFFILYLYFLWILIMFHFSIPLYVG